MVATGRLADTLFWLIGSLRLVALVVFQSAFPPEAACKQRMRPTDVALVVLLLRDYTVKANRGRVSADAGRRASKPEVKEGPGVCLWLCLSFEPSPS